MVSDKSDGTWDNFIIWVLILVLMEYGLWLTAVRLTSLSRAGLNPCSNGIWSLTIFFFWSEESRSVLILVLMEYGLWHEWRTRGIWKIGLNPCSNGIWSLTRIFILQYPDTSNVLILVLMEYGLWRYPSCFSVASRYSLTPCSNGIWSLTLRIVSSTECVLS